MLGSAVNPVLREGNSDRRSAFAVKNQMKNFKKNLNSPWSKDSKTEVVHMTQGDFYGSEQSHVCAEEGEVLISFTDANNSTKQLKTVKVLDKEVIDFAVMDVTELRNF